MTVTTTNLPGATITTGPKAWQVLQRDADGMATIELAGNWYGEVPSVVEVRVAREDWNAPVAGCDWRDAEMLPNNGWRITLRVPTGGLYRLDTRVRSEGTEWRNVGDTIWHLSVGDLWVIAGQSNAVGYGHGVVNDPPAMGVSVFAVNEEWRMATHPIFDTTGTQHPANRDSGRIDVSPWLTFSKLILQQAGVPVGLIPTALGGSPLSAWDPGNPEGAYLYENMRAMIEAAGGRVAGMVWYQGCTDANDNDAPTYLARFTRFVQAVRAQYGEQMSIITAQLNRCVDVTAEGDPHWTMIREAQRQAARVIPQLAVVPTLDCPLSDGIHNSAVGNVMIGERFGRMALGMVYGQELPWQTVDARAARFTDATRQQIRISFDHVVDHLVYLGATPQDMRIEDAEGVVPVTQAVVDGTADVLLTLGRAAQGRTLCQHAFGGNPVSCLRDHLQQPVPAFTLEVDEV